MTEIDSIREYTRGRAMVCIKAMMNQLSGTLFQLILEDDWNFNEQVPKSSIPLLFNHDNTVIKYLARSAAEMSEGSVFRTFLLKYLSQVLEELEDKFLMYYQDHPTEAHDLSIRYEMEANQLTAYLDVLLQIDPEEAKVLGKWLDTNPVQYAVEDWS